MRLVKGAKDTTNTSYKSAGFLWEKVKEVEKATADASKLFTDAQGMAGSAAVGAKGTPSREVELVLAAFVKPSEVLTSLSQTRSSAENAHKAAAMDLNVFIAVYSAEDALALLEKNPAESPVLVTKELKEATSNAALFAEAAVGHVEAASTAADKASEHAEKAITSAGSWLEQIEAALKRLKERPKGSKHTPDASQPPPLKPAVQTKDALDNRDLLRSVSTAMKTSDNQKANMSPASTPTKHNPGSPKARREVGDVSDTPKELADNTERSETGTRGSEDDTTRASTVSAQGLSAADSSKETDAAGKNAPETDAHNTLQDIRSMDSSVSPPWVRTPLLLVAGVLGLLAVC
ncbi:hypothetical protein DQ04_13711000 [Trypanosoma grayi]|uniref:hypothetical protein n=1 Tax=Trypanosoma grayi TaxID=71804 RepID=UPI0004F4A07E|nr:hypothetical protein DQ04_13711000 [Trypanosoma grayi]KEG06482.1 hypothetical protein DQ04_13711000 [Trypanosoma grayi]